MNDDAIDGILRTQKVFVTESFDRHSHVEKTRKKEREWQRAKKT